MTWDGLTLHKQGARHYGWATMLNLFCYLDPGDGKIPVWQLGLYVAAGLAVVLLVVYALTRFVVWASRR